MARRILEAELLASQGISQQPMGPGKEIHVIKEVKLHQTFNGVYSVQFNYTGETLAVGYGSGGVQLFETKTGTMVKELRSCRQGGYAIIALRFHPKEPHILYAASSEGYLYVFDTDTAQLVNTLTESGNEINCMDFCVDGYNYVTGGKDLKIRLYETKNNKLVKEWEGYNERTVVTDKTKVGNTMRVFSLRFHPNNQYIFISGGWDNHIKIWDVRDNEGIKRNILGPHICGDALDMKDNNILAGQWTALHSLQEYDYTTGKVCKELKYPNKDGAFLYAALYGNNDTVFAGGSGTQRAEAIEISTNRTIGGYHLPGPIHTIDSANQGRVIAVGGAASVFALLSMTE